MLGNKAIAFLICIGAGMSTTLGAAVVYSPYLVQLSNRNILAGGLGLSAGVMLYVSFIEIFAKSYAAFVHAGYSDAQAYLYSTLCFFAGIAFMRSVDALSHCIEHYGSHASDEKSQHGSEDEIEVMLHIVERLEQQQHLAESRTETTFTADGDLELSASNLRLCNFSEDAPQFPGLDTLPEDPPLASPKPSDVMSRQSSDDDNKHLKKMGFMTALAIGIHNFPEGLATFVATAENPQVGIALAIAVAIHNVPEGLCVAVPLYYSSGDRHSAFLYAFLSGVSEVLGGAMGWVILSDLFDDIVYAIVFGIVAGMMVCITIYELLPTAQKCQSKQYPHLASDWVLVGMAVMAASLVAFKF